MANSLPPQLTGLSFLDNRRSQVPRSWPKHELQVNAIFFFWLAIHDRCWTGDRRKRHNLQDVDNCTFCDQQSETISHLSTECVLARETWYLVLRRYNLQRHTPSLANSDFVESWLLSRKQLRKEIRKAFDSLVILVAWSNATCESSKKWNFL